MTQQVPANMTVEGLAAATTVLTSGNQTVGGTKTFSSPPVIGTAPMVSQSGTAPLYQARAWCIFNGASTGANAPTAGANITSITRNSAGNYTVNITTAMPSANYAVIATPLGGSYVAVVTGTPGVSSFVLENRLSTSGANSDATSIMLAIFA